MTIVPPFPGRRTTTFSSLTDAEQRGWGKGWPADRSKDMAPVVIAGSTRRVSVQKAIAPFVAYLVTETVARGYDLAEGADEGGYVNRPMMLTGGKPSTTPSNHSWGLALDLEWLHNPQRSGPAVTNMPAWLPVLWEEWGFNWGGRWRDDGKGISDTMHYEFALRAADAAAICAHLAGHQPSANGQGAGGASAPVTQVAFVAPVPTLPTIAFSEVFMPQYVRGDGPIDSTAGPFTGPGAAVYLVWPDGSLTHVDAAKNDVLDKLPGDNPVTKATIIPQKTVDAAPKRA